MVIRHPASAAPSSLQLANSEVFNMKLLIVLFILFTAFQTSAQTYLLPAGEYMDTTTNKDTTCKDYHLYYYQVGGKYLEASSTILNETKIFLNRQPKNYNGSGYITFRFMINCDGNRLTQTQVFQTDENYKTYHFDTSFINELYSFLNTLRKWKIAKEPAGKVHSYTTFITFKIENGKVVNIIP